MARNGSGTYSVPNSFTPSTTIESAKVNANFSDIGSEITNSLPRDGQAAMTGQLKAASGTAALPSVTFSSDLDTGFYRKDANTIGVACGGVEVGSFDSAGAKTSAGASYDAFPSGTVCIFGQTAAPTGWTKLTDQDNAALRVVSGTAGTGGSANFTTAFAARTISILNLPDHNLTVTDPGHAHAISVSDDNLFTGPATGGGFTQYSFDGPDTTSSATTGITVAFGSAARGGSQTAMDFAVKYVDVIRAQKD